jgi:hypothetical protein
MAETTNGLSPVTKLVRTEGNAPMTQRTFFFLVIARNTAELPRVTKRLDIVTIMRFPLGLSKREIIPHQPRNMDRWITYSELLESSSLHARGLPKGRILSVRFMLNLRSALNAKTNNDIRISKDELRL